MNVPAQLRNRSASRLLIAGLLVLSFGIAGALPATGATLGTLTNLGTAHAAGSCQLNSAGGSIQHVIYIQFDNTHLTRDRPNVPSDLEQMPNLLNFMRNNGIVSSNHHTPLISHTATDILTSLTGLYGDRMGVPVANSYRYYNPDGTTNLGVSFAYWTDPIYDPTTSKATDTTYNMLTSDGKNAPAPWVPFTRAGCDVGAVATANTVLENIGTDIPTVFGANSPQAAEVKANPDQATADFVGIGVHCAQSSALCAGANGGRPDLLPDEPGGYTGFSGLFGHKYVAPQIGGTGAGGTALKDLNGSTIQTSTGKVGFPGFDGMSAAVSLGYVAAMQEHGVPVTYAYISDAHDNHTTATAMGPGEAPYEAQLHAYDAAFGNFFTRLAGDGITSANTLFVFTSDENDHFAGGAGVPAGCDGVTVPCTYPKIGEVNANMTGLLATEQNVTTPFKVHSDSAPTVYVTGNPARDATTTRTLERATGNLTALNPITGTTDQVSLAMADPVEMKLLHMITADPARTPTFTEFANPDYYLFAGAPNCSQPCVAELPAFAWNHGDFTPDITTTWLGMVGPGVRHLGISGATWSDHTDIRPTIMSLVGLKDDYTHDGRVLFEDLENSALPASLQASTATLTQLAQVYKQIDAAVGQLGLDTLRISTAALQSNAPNDATYNQLESQLALISSDRDRLAAQMNAALEGAEFKGQAIDATQASSLIAQGQALLNRVSGLTQPVTQAHGNSFSVVFNSALPGQGRVYFGSGPGCLGLVQTATQDQGTGTTHHQILVTGNDLPGTVGSVGILPGNTYWYEVATTTASGEVIDNNGGKCYSVTIPGGTSG